MFIKIQTLLTGKIISPMMEVLYHTELFWGPKLIFFVGSGLAGSDYQSLHIHIQYTNQMLQ